jgi:hypothetical protein
VLAVVAVSLAVTGAALAAGAGEPRKVIIPAVQAKAKAINVKLSDLPAAGWTAKPSDNSGSTPRCSYYNPNQSDLTENGDASSPQFTLPSASYISSSTSIFKSAAQGRTAYARVIQPKLPLCLAELFRKGAGAKAKVKVLSAAARAFPNVAERTNAYRIAADFTVSKTKIRTVADFVAFNRGKVDTVIFFVGIGGAFKDSLERSVATKVAGRAAKASS